MPGEVARIPDDSLNQTQPSGRLSCEERLVELPSCSYKDDQCQDTVYGRAARREVTLFLASL